MSDEETQLELAEEAAIGAPVRRIARALSPMHGDELRASGLTRETIAASGIYTEEDERKIKQLLNWRQNYSRESNGVALVFPYYLPGRTDPFLSRVKLSKPRVDDNQKVRKYEQPVGAGTAPYFPPRSRRGLLSDSKIPLVFTEGEKKALLLDQLGYATVGASGVWNFHDAVAHKVEERWTLHEETAKHAVVEGRECFIVFDSDSATNESVMKAARRLAAMLQGHGASVVRFVRIPADEGRKYGIDDWYMAKGEAATRALFDAAEPIEGATDDEAFDAVRTIPQLRGIDLDERIRMPRGYRVGKRGELLVEVAKKDSLTWTEVERSPIFITRSVTDLYSGKKRVELTFRDGSARWVRANVTRRAIGDSRTAISELIDIGAPITSGTAGDVVKWLAALEAANVNRLPDAKSVGRSGWHLVDGQRVFVSGGQVITPADGKPIELLVEDLHATGTPDPHRPRGELDAHRAAITAAWTASPIAAATIAAAAAAPLLHMLGLPGWAFHLVGQSSRGKSSMLKIAASLFGDPRSPEWVTSWNATSVGLEVRAFQLCDLPLCVDEAGMVDAQQREKATYMLADGVGRTRGAKDGGLREKLSWRTVVLSTGERPLAEETTATGAQARVIQMIVDGFGALDGPGVDAIRRQAEENSGQLGAEWLGALVDTAPETWITLQSRCRAIAKELSDVAAGNGLRARQSTYWALLILTETLLHQVLNIGTPTGETMRRLAAESASAAIEVIGDGDRALEVLQGWFWRCKASFPRLEMQPSGAKVPKGEAGIREVYGYQDLAEGRLYILAKALKDILDSEGLSARVVLGIWHARGWLDVTDGRNNHQKQIRVQGGRLWVVSFDGAVLGMDGPSDEFGATDDDGAVR